MDSRSLDYSSYGSECLVLGVGRVLLLEEVPIHA